MYKRRNKLNQVEESGNIQKKKQFPMSLILPCIIPPPYELRVPVKVIQISAQDLFNGPQISPEKKYKASLGCMYLA